jgi:hypothetical protein
MANQESSDAYLDEYFRDVNLAAIHAGQVTIKDKDFSFVRSIQQEDKLFNPSTSGGVDEAHERQAKNRNTNTAGLGALCQFERGRGHQTRLVYGDLGPSQSTQGSARHGGKPTVVAKGTTPLSSKPNQEAFQASVAPVIVRPVKPHSMFPLTKRINKRRPTARRGYFLAESKWKSQKGIGTVERNLKILIRRLMRKPFVIWKRKRVLSH